MEPSIDTAVVLAAGSGTRLHPLTEKIPKTLLAVDGERTILDIILAALATAGVTRIRLVVGHAADAVLELVGSMEETHGVTIEAIDNPHPERNNAYSLWLGLSGINAPALVVNGDTVFQAEVPRRLLWAPPGGVLLAVDSSKPLADEEMKVTLDESGKVSGLSKGIDPDQAHGEYIGVARLSADALEPVQATLEAAWQRDPTLFYEEGFDLDAQSFTVIEVGDLPWTEVDTPADLALARELFGR